MPGTRNQDYCLYLWNDKREQYEKFQCEENLPYFESYVDGIRAWYNNTVYTKTMVTYKWDGVKLVKISEEEIAAE